VLGLLAAQAEHSAAEVADAEQRARDEAAAREAAERRAGDIERQIAAITEVQRTERGLVVTLSGDVLFEFDRATLLPAAELKLRQLADTLKRASLGLTVEGHTDAIGSDAYNQDLSTRRAVAVRDYLLAQGVPADRLKVAGFGEGRPIATNTTDEGRAMNRRVEIIIETDQLPDNQSPLPR
jgi:outer membrane protein OmpA-like peptidoglycan-associated protein